MTWSWSVSELLLLHHPEHCRQLTTHLFYGQISSHRRKNGWCCHVDLITLNHHTSSASVSKPFWNKVFPLISFLWHRKVKGLPFTSWEEFAVSSPLGNGYEVLLFEGPFRLEFGVLFVILSALCDIGLIYSCYLSLENAWSWMVSRLKEQWATWLATHLPSQDIASSTLDCPRLGDCPTVNVQAMQFLQSQK